MKKLLVRLKNKEIIRFMIAGASNTIVSYIAYLALFFVTKNYIIANASGFVFGTISAYLWNSRFVFEHEKTINLIKVVKSFVSYGSTFILNTVLLGFIINFFHISAVIAPLINTVLIFILNFILNKFWVFRKGEKSE